MKAPRPSSRRAGNLLRAWSPLAAAVAFVTLQPATVRAHEVEVEVVRGGAVAVRATHSDGEPLADAMAEVYSPRDASTPHQRGRSDRNGWVSFVPDAAGSWRIRVVEADGHGVDTRVEIDHAHVRAGGREHGHDHGVAVVAPGLRFILRPVAGVLAIMAVFLGLFLWRRCRRA